MQWPRLDEHTSTLLVADLRLDNSQELAGKLSVDGPLPSRASAVPLLLRAWQTWGERCVEHLLGGFAFACWDETEHCLFVARDHAGEKPLFFMRTEAAFAFASMPKGLLALRDRNSRSSGPLDEERFAESLTGVESSDTRTLFTDIEELPPGHCLVLTQETIRVRPYWNPANTPQIRYRRDQEYIEDFRERFDRAVDARLRTSGGIGSHLSSGLDSSSVTATAARLLAHRGARLSAFTSIPVSNLPPLTWPGRFADEGPAAAEVAAMYPNIDHALVNASGQDIIATLEQTARLTDEPAYNVINYVWLSRILDECRQRGIHTLLWGSGGNGTISFDGMASLYEMFRAGRWLRLARAAYTLRANGYTSFRGAARWTFGPLVPSRIPRFWPASQRASALSYSPLHSAVENQYRLREKVFEQSHKSNVNVAKLLRRFHSSYNRGSMNVAAAAGWGVEYRDPTQDKRIVEFCFAIPPEQFIAGGQTRSLVRRGMVGRLPESTLKRTRRGIQAADWYLIMGAQLDRLKAELTRTERSPLAQRLLDLPRLRSLLNTWPTSNFEDVAVTDAYHLALTRGLAAGRFLTMHDPDFRPE